MYDEWFILKIDKYIKTYLYNQSFRIKVIINYLRICFMRLLKVVKENFLVFLKLFI